jgi:hypothetical protein
LCCFFVKKKHSENNKETGNKTQQHKLKYNKNLEDKEIFKKWNKKQKDGQWKRNIRKQENQARRFNIWESNILKERLEKSVK